MYLYNSNNRSYIFHLHWSSHEYVLLYQSSCRRLDFYEKKTVRSENRHKTQPNNNVCVCVCVWEWVPFKHEYDDRLGIVNSEWIKMKIEIRKPFGKLCTQQHLEIMELNLKFKYLDMYQHSTQNMWENHSTNAVTHIDLNTFPVWSRIAVCY